MLKRTSQLHTRNAWGYLDYATWEGGAKHAIHNRNPWTPITLNKHGDKLYRGNIEGQVQAISAHPAESFSRDSMPHSAQAAPTESLIPRQGRTALERPLFTHQRRAAHRVVTTVGKEYFDRCGGDMAKLRGRQPRAVCDGLSHSEALRLHALLDQVLYSVPGPIADARPDVRNARVWIGTTFGSWGKPEEVMQAHRAEYDSRAVTLEASPDDLGLPFHSLRRLLYLAEDSVTDDVLSLSAERFESRSHNYEYVQKHLRALVADASRAEINNADIPARIVRVDKPRGLVCSAMVLAKAPTENKAATKLLAAWCKAKKSAPEIRHAANWFYPVRPLYEQHADANVHAVERGGVDDMGYLGMKESTALKSIALPVREAMHKQRLKQLRSEGRATVAERRAAAPAAKVVPVLPDEMKRQNIQSRAKKVPPKKK